jgi:hypothetical protein
LETTSQVAQLSSEKAELKKESNRALDEMEIVRAQ